MKIVDAVWEKRNLGVDTSEITVEPADMCEDVTQVLMQVNSEYCVIKVPSYRPDLLDIIQDNGYRYIEDMVYVTHYLQEIPYSSIQKRFHSAIHVERMNEEDIGELCIEIEKGLFDSDRIFLDPYFSHELAKQRYINWVHDEYEKNTDFFKYVYKGNTVGFFGLKELEGGHYTSFLGGIYKEYRKGGIGSIVKVPEVVRNLGGKTVSTSVSTNNAVQLKSLTMNGYIPESISHTFIKHNKRREK